MAEKEPGDDRPSLQMPSLGFGRKRKQATPEPAAAPEESERAATPPPEPEAPPVPAPELEPGPEPAPTERFGPVPPAAAAPPLFADEAPATRPTAVAQTEHGDSDEDDEPAASARKQRRALALPGIGGMFASLLTGLLVGLLTVGLTWASLRLCEVVQGTPSCGNPGFFLLLAIMVSMVLVGMALLKAFAVPDPGSTSFLGMGLVAVVALLFLVELLFLWWMVLVIPAVAMASYALSHWVTTSFADEPVGRDMHR